MLTVQEIVADVVTRLAGAGVPYAIGGSLASGTWGQMRHTNDADFVIRISPATARPLIDAFSNGYLISEAEVADAVNSREQFRSIQLLNEEESFKIDLFVLNDGPYERSEIERARTLPITEAVKGRFSAPENIILAKLRWFVLGNRVSDRQWNDIVQVLEVQRGKLDESYLDRWAEHFEVLDLLNDARSQTYP